MPNLQGMKVRAFDLHNHAQLQITKSALSITMPAWTLISYKIQWIKRSFMFIFLVVWEAAIQMESPTINEMVAWDPLGGWDAMGCQ